mmetsp:Transcript_1232/g.3581  ORF Transcript_1232/g.3581 Transcript_1232/m.3581 type:complete len:148 (-) Transcript_1232:122-565(-)
MRNGLQVGCPRHTLHIAYAFGLMWHPSPGKSHGAAGTTGASHLTGTASQAAREMMTSQIESASSSVSNAQSRTIPTGNNQGAGSAAPPWQAEMRARQQQRAEQGGGGDALPGDAVPQAAPRGSMPGVSSINSELEAVLARRRNSAQS